jgi:ribosomal protein S18 acetylase RimI-like enzyme
MTHLLQTPRGPALPDGVTVAFGAARDVDALRPLWLALHHLHQEADPEVAELETIYLVPEERGRGLGSLVLDIVDAELEARGLRDLVVGAVPGNTAALRLYERGASCRAGRS